MHLGIVLAQVPARRAQRIEDASGRLLAVASAVGGEREPAALHARLTELRSAGITALRAVDFDGAVIEERENELVYRASGLEVRMALGPLEASLRWHALGLGLAGLLSIGAACAAACFFVLRDRTIRAAQQVGDHARRHEEQSEELLAARQRVESAERAKTEFLANVSHELRTPLTAILGFTDVLILEDGAGGGRSHLEEARTIQRNGYYLYRLLAGLLDYSNLETGRLCMRWDPCSPGEIVRDIELVSGPEAEAKGLRLRLEIEDDVPATMTSDAARVRQIVSQLVENAVKFTSQGSVTLRLSRLREGYADDHVAFDVVDTGAGMTDDQLEHMFEPFAQGDGSRSRQHAGMGLGLALVHRLAARLGGEITVVSSVGEGSAFRLLLPVEPRRGGSEQDPEQGSASPAELAPVNCRVLLAEDGPDNRRLIRLMLRKAGADVTTVDNGHEAVELAMAAWRAEEPFAVILMDMQMPVTDGISATRSLRLQNYSGIIIALTADARAANRELCLRAGCDEFLSKPIDRDLLLATIHALLKPAG